MCHLEMCMCMCMCVETTCSQLFLMQSVTPTPSQQTNHITKTQNYLMIKKPQQKQM